MGLFKDLRKLNKMGQEQLDKMDVAGSMANLQQQLDSLTAQPHAGDAAEASRIPGTATVVSIRDTGTLMNNQNVVELVLMVLLPTGIPVNVTRTLPVSPVYLPQMQPGAQVGVRYDPADAPGSLVLAG